jgi:hypothetical protein
MPSPEKYPQRNAEIIARREAGEEPRNIAKAMGLSRSIVLGALNRAGKCVPGFRARGESTLKSKLTNAAVADIRRNCVLYRRGASTVDFATKYGVRAEAVRIVLKRKTWGHVE